MSEGHRPGLKSYCHPQKQSSSKFSWFLRKIPPIYSRSFSKRISTCAKLLRRTREFFLECFNFYLFFQMATTSSSSAVKNRIKKMQAIDFKICSTEVRRLSNQISEVNEVIRKTFCPLLLIFYYNALLWGYTVNLWRAILRLSRSIPLLSAHGVNNPKLGWTVTHHTPQQYGEGKVMGQDKKDKNWHWLALNCTFWFF